MPPRKRRVPKPVCQWCKTKFDPQSDKPKDACACPPAEGMRGTFKVLNKHGNPEERRYGVWPDEEEK